MNSLVPPRQVSLRRWSFATQRKAHLPARVPESARLAWRDRSRGEGRHLIIDEPSRHVVRFGQQDLLERRVVWRRQTVHVVRGVHAEEADAAGREERDVDRFLRDRVSLPFPAHEFPCSGPGQELLNRAFAEASDHLEFLSHPGPLHPLTHDVQQRIDLTVQSTQEASQIGRAHV